MKAIVSWPRHPQDQAEDGDRPASTKTEREFALLFILHLAGDIHQPLHCATNSDRGGNCLPVDYSVDGHHLHASTSDNGLHYNPNLHHVWDVDLVERPMPTDGNGKPDAAAYADDLSHRFQNDIATWKQQGLDIEGWAWETHVIADNTAYVGLSVPVPVQSLNGQLADCTGNHNIGATMAQLQVDMEDSYADTARPIVETQLAKAGTRLAMILNDIWP